MTGSGAKHELRKVAVVKAVLKGFMAKINIQCISPTKSNGLCHAIQWWLTMPFLHSLHTNDGKAEGTPWDDWQGTFAESSSLAGAVVVVVVGSTDLYAIPLLGKQYQIPLHPHWHSSKLILTTGHGRIRVRVTRICRSCQNIQI